MPNKPNKKATSGFISIALLSLLLVVAFYMLMGDAGASKKPTYQDILGYFEDQKVSEYTLDFGTRELVLKLNDKDKTEVVYTVPNITMFVEYTEPLVAQYNEENPNSPIKYDYIPAAETPWWLSMLPTLLLIVAMVALWVYMARQAGGGKVNSFGKSRAKQIDVSASRTTFADVAGAEEEKEELAEIVEFLKRPQQFNALGAKIPKGVLLVGPPGTGKTLLAKAVAGEAHVPFFSISGSDFVEMFVGVGASRVRDLFDTAKKNSPAIVFIDEIDAVGRQRGAGLGGGNDEREQTLNQLLVELDGFGANEGVIVIAATNRRDVLDPALLRPGRFDREVYVGYPDVDGREAILKVHAKNKPLAPDVDLRTIAQTTTGFVGADLANLVNEAALLAAKRGKKAVTKADFEEATIKVVAGPEKRSHKVIEKDRRLTAYHEAGHAVATYYCPTQDPVHQVSIVPRGAAGGYTMSLPVEDSFVRTKKGMFESIVTLLGGRVAESLVLDDISTGASNDLERATAIAKSMVTRYGFSNVVGPIVYGSDQNEVFLGRDFAQNRDFSESTAAKIDTEIRNMVQTAYIECEEILKEHLDKLHLLASVLLQKEKVDGEEFANLMKFGTTTQPQPTQPDQGPKEGQQPQAQGLC